MKITQSFGQALKRVRTSKNLTQEDFSEVSSRTYISTLERGLYAPTLEKIDALSNFIEIHPLTLITLSYLIKDRTENVKSLFELVNNEISNITEASDTKIS